MLVSLSALEAVGLLMAGDCAPIVITKAGLSLIGDFVVFRHISIDSFRLFLELLPLVSVTNAQQSDNDANTNERTSDRSKHIRRIGPIIIVTVGVLSNTI